MIETVFRWGRPFQQVVGLSIALIQTTATTLANQPLPSITGRHLLNSDGSWFQLRGFAYSPTPIGESPEEGTVTTYSDARLIARDGPIMAEAGANTIRIFGTLRIEKNGIWEIGTTSAFIREAAEHGLWIVMGSFIDPDTDFTDPALRQTIVDAHIELVRQFKGEPNILMWAPGNELNFFTDQLSDWYSLQNEIAMAIKAEQGGASGPEFGPYVCGITNVINKDGSPGIAPQDEVPAVDIWAVNVFRGPTMGTLFQQVESMTSKPFWIAETGIDSLNNGTMVQDERAQALFAKALWAEIENHCHLVFGGNLGFYSDEFWKTGNPVTQEAAGMQFGEGPDNFTNEEHLGVMRIEKVEGEIDKVTKKEAWFAIRDGWSRTCPCPILSPPLPFEANFDAATHTGATANNFAGFNFAIYGGSFPDFRDDAAVSISADAPGSTGVAGDLALHATGTLAAGSTSTFFSIIITLFPPTVSPAGIDVTGFDTLRFDIKIGSPSAHHQFDVRLEDSDLADEFLNKELPLPDLTVNWQTVEFALADFITGGGPLVDLNRLAQIVFDASIPALQPIEYELDLLIDNVEILKTSREIVPLEITIGNTSLPGGRSERILTYPLDPSQAHTVEYDDDLTADPGYQPLPGAPHDRGCAQDRENLSQRFYRMKREDGNP